MEHLIKTVVYPTKDLAKTKERFKKLLGIEPYADTPYYVGFKTGGIDIGVDPNGHTWGTTIYYAVDDIQKELKQLVGSGALVLQEVKKVGEGRSIAVVKDSDGNIIGLQHDA